ncbi:MAG: HD domain-containing protein [Clostridiales bacterium]
MYIDEKYKKILVIVENKLTCSAHNLDHIFRVYNLCLLIAKNEKDVDLEVLIPAALLHDIARDEESKDKKGEIDHAILGSKNAEKILRDLEYDEKKIESIKNCIKTHRFRTGSEPLTIEAKILFDADKLDSIGAVGIARTFMIAGQFGQRITISESYSIYDNSNVVENGRLKDISKHTPFIEYEIKLKKIVNKLYTNSAKIIGKDRSYFMEDFFNRLKLEMEGIR